MTEHAGRPQGNVQVHMSQCSCTISLGSPRVLLKNLKDLHARRLLEAELIRRAENNVSDPLLTPTKFERDILNNVVNFDIILDQI